MLQHAVLVNAGFVGKSVIADNRFVARRVHAGDAGDQAGSRIEASGIDSGVQPEELLARLQGHDDLLETAVTRTLANAVYRALDLAGPGRHGGETVGHGHAEVVVAVYRERDAVDPVDMRLQVAKQAIELGRNRIADRVRNIDGRGTGVDGGTHHFGQVGRFGSRRIFRRKLHILHELARQAYRADRALDDLLLRHLELVFAVNRAGRDEDVNPVPARAAHRLMDLFDVARIAAREAADRRAVIGVGDSFDRFEVARRSRGKSRLDDIDAKIGQRSRDAELFLERHAAARRLFAVAQAGIEYAYFVRCHELTPSASPYGNAARHRLFRSGVRDPP